MEKYLVTIEFRYNGLSKDGKSTDNKNKIVTIGVFDTSDEAITKGNEALQVLEKQFKLNPHYNTKDRFSKNGGCFGSPKYLITNLAYLQTPFSFYAKITKLNYFDLEQTIFEVVESGKKYREYKIAEKE